MLIYFEDAEITRSVEPWGTHFVCPYPRAHDSGSTHSHSTSHGIDAVRTRSMFWRESGLPQIASLPPPSIYRKFNL